MNLSELTPTTKKPNKRLGRGYGSGKAKTSGRGTKGQKARGKTRPGFEGGQLPLIKRLPFVRGFGNTTLRTKPVAVNAARLSVFADGSTISPETLVEKGLVEASYRGPVKIIGLTGQETFKFEGVVLTKAGQAKLSK